ncbi:MAG: AsmA-like C-terminal domain-containing protein [Desulfobacterales bacterium]
MSKSKKITIWLVRILGVFTMLIVLAMVLSPRLINLEMVSNQIKDRMSRDIDGEIKFQKMVLSYFPRPHVSLHQAEVRIPDSFTIKIHRMRFYPKIWPLFRGQLQVSSVRLENADYFMKLPQISRTEPLPGDIVSVDSIVKEVANAVKGLPEFNLPNLKLNIKDGQVKLVDPFGRKFELSELQAEYHSRPDKFDFSIKCKSNLWDQIDINGFLNPADFRGRGIILLSRFRPQTLLAYLKPNSKLQVIDTRANLRIDFESQGAGSLTADFDGAIPFLELGHDKQKLAFKGGRFKGRIGIGDRAIKVKLTELGLDDPQLTATGMFSYDEDQKEIRLAINGAEINADSVRQITLALAGESETISNIFNIIRGGHVPRMSVQTQGHSMAELGRLENIIIKGRMTRGKIFIPGAELDLEDVNGDALISEGILNGDNLQARMGKTRGQNGTLKLGLNEEIAPFKLKIDVNADLAQLPPVLSRIVDDADFINELAKIKDVKGSARGTLILGDDLKNLGATVKVSKAELSARYDRIPYPILLEGGHFIYDDYRIDVDKFNAHIGNSTLNQFSCAINWSGTPTLDFKTQSATLNLEELYAWLLSFERYQQNLVYIGSLYGNAAVEELSIKGPFFNPQDWHFISRGTLNNLKVSSKQLPQPLSIDRGQFSWNPAVFALTDIDASLGKSTISQLSASFELNKLSAFVLQSKSVNLFAGEIYPWLSSIERFKPALEDFKVNSGNLGLHDLVLSGPFHQPDKWQYQVDGDMQDLVVNSDAFGGPVTVNKGTFELTTELITDEPRKKIKFDKTNLTWGNSQLTFNGEIELKEKDIRLGSTISADTIDWTPIKSFLDYIKKRQASPDRPARDGHVLGTLKVLTDKFNYDSYSVQPLQAEISFNPEKLTIAIQQASVCSINFRGLFNVDEQTLEIYLIPTAVDQNLALAAPCITGQKEMATGTFNLSGELLSKSKPEAVVQSLTGNIAFSAKEGRIYRLGILAKILSILNVTEIYRGEVPDLTGEGFAYRSMTANAEINGGKLIMKECAIDGASMGIACDGNIDFAEKKMDLTVLVAPFKTIDRLVDIIPLVGHVLGGKLISIPFKAKGDLKDPDVTPLPPMAVGAGVLGILERTLKLPITIIQPIFPEGKTKTKDQKQP